MVRSKSHAYGNSNVDRRWMEEHSAELKPIEPDAEGETPFRAMVEWSGKDGDVGSPWMYPPDGQRCVGTSFVRDVEGNYVLDADGERLQRPCWQWPIIGARVCIAHGGSIERVKRAAHLRMLGALDKVTGALIEIAMNPKTPERDRIAAINSIMDRSGVKGGQDISDTLAPWEELLRSWIAGGPRRDGEEDGEAEDA